MPGWFLTLITNIGTALIKSAVSEAAKNLKESREAAEQERLNGIRNGVNAKKYLEATTRAEQIRAAVDLLNRNSV